MADFWLVLGDFAQQSSAFALHKLWVLLNTAWSARECLGAAESAWEYAR